MKLTITHLMRVALGSALLAATPVLAQEVVRQTTTSGGVVTSTGTISEFSPDTIILRSANSPEPIRYSYSKSTTYVDETGAPVSIETVRSGVPVTVSYIREGDRLIASKVIVQRAAAPATTTTTVVPAAPPAIEKRETTTTTTTTKKNDD